MELFLWPPKKGKPSNRTEVWTKISPLEDEEFKKMEEISKYIPQSFVKDYGCKFFS